MCVIVISPNKASRPTLETLDRCAKANPHGSGFSWLESGRVHYLKGMSTKAIAKSLGEIKGPAIIHFRIASVGGIHPRLCHPFEITERPGSKLYGSADRVLFHNGTWMQWQNWERLNGLHLKGQVSDTRVAAAAAWQNGFEWLKDTGSKYVLFGQGGKIQTIGEFSKLSDGCLYSNLWWKASVSGRSLAREAMACFSK